jgi:hypothetical protein
MSERLRSRLMRAWPIPLCAAALLLAPATASAAPKPQCDTRVNDTPSELVECVQQKDLMGQPAGAPGHRERESGPGRHAVAQLG